MVIKMKKAKSLFVIFLLTVLLLGFSNAVGVTASAEESSTSSVVMTAASLAQHTSYLTDSYFGVIKLSVDDKNIAAATTDAQGHVVVTAISSGKTTVRYWYKSIASVDWTSAAMPVTVTGTVAPESAASSTGLVFTQSSANITVGRDYTLSGITLNGTTVNPGSLLWVSSSASVATVDSSSGKITAAGPGTAVVYAIEPSTKSVASINILAY